MFFRHIQILPLLETKAINEITEQIAKPKGHKNQGILEAIREDRPYNEAERAAYANLAGIMGRAAAHMGRTITWKEMLASNFGFSPIVDEAKFGGPAPVEPDAQGNYPVPIPGKWVEV